MLKFITDIQDKKNITEIQFAKELGLKDQTALRALKKATKGMSIKKLIALYRSSGDSPEEFLARLENEYCATK